MKSCRKKKNSAQKLMRMLKGCKNAIVSKKNLTALPLSDPGNRGGEGAECPWYAGNKDVDEGGVKGVPRARAVYRFVQPVVRMASNTKKKMGE